MACILLPNAAAGEGGEAGLLGLEGMCPAEIVE